MDTLRDYCLVLLGAGLALFAAGLLPARRPCVFCPDPPEPRPVRNSALPQPSRN